MAVLSRVRPVAVSWPDRRTLLGLLLAAVAAGLVLMLTRPAATTPILYANSDVPAGTPIEELDLGVRRVASADGLVVGDAVGELEGWTLSVPLAAGEPLLASLLTPPAVQAAPGALAITLDAGNAVQGLIQPGDLIDILVTTRGAADEQAVTATVASGVYVLRASTGESGIDDGEVALVLAIDDATAKRIVNARERGTVDLVRVSR